MLDWRALRGDLADLVLARTCAGCELPGTVLCAACWTTLTRSFIEHDLPCGTSAIASTVYRGIGKSVVIAHKEHGWHALTPILGILLARAVTTVTDGPVNLVPIPPHANSLAKRGTDPLADIVNAAARSLREIGQPAVRSPLLVRIRDDGAVKRLGRDARRRSVQSSFALSRTQPKHRGQVVVVDDIITTGITLTEARRSLEQGGITVCGAVAVASTPLHYGTR
jgi:predicted amidophosphoribosyltransferase